MIYLNNSCSCSELRVLPANWNSSKVSVKNEWQIYYRFYDPMLKQDPRYKNGKLVRLKGMNHFKDISERRSHTKQLITEELARLKNGFNPIFSKRYELTTSSIKPNTKFLEALTTVAYKIKGARSTKNDIKNILSLVAKAAVNLGLTNIQIDQISRKHIKIVLEQIDAIQGNESAHRYNKVRTYLMILFKELVELEAIQSNPVREICKKHKVQVIRTTLSQSERQLINYHPKTHHYRFWLFTHIFFHSGARISELMQVRRSEIDLDNQYFVVTIRKGKQSKQIRKPIKNTSLPYWQEAIKNAEPGDFIFAAGLKPGTAPINRDQITKRWKKHVKERLGIQPDFYSLKHLHLDEIAALSGLENAAAMASHTSTSITLKHYTVNEVQRRNDQLKALNNPFA